MEHVPIWSPQPISGDDQLSLRPQYLTEYIGQGRLKENLAVALGSAKKRQMPLDHILLCGPPGLGKTTLAGILAKEMQAQIYTTSGPVLNKTGDLAAILSKLEEGDVLFVDEIHRLPTTVEEILYPAMEDWKLDLMMGQGPQARSIRLDLPKFTLIGATTRSGLLSSPLRDRFGLIMRLEYYSTLELGQIITRTAGILDCAIDNKSAQKLAGCSRGTPRVANRYTKRVRDVATVNDTSTIDMNIVNKTFKMLDVDSLGFDPLDRQYLHFLVHQFSGGPVGLTTLAAALGEEPQTIEEVIEPYLLQQGMLERSPRGRKATQKAIKHIEGIYEN